MPGSIRGATLQAGAEARSAGGSAWRGAVNSRLAAAATCSGWK